MDRLYEVVKKIDIELNDHQLEQFQRYYELLVEWNLQINRYLSSSNSMKCL